MGIGPIAAIPKVLTQVGLTKDDIDIYEVNHCLLCSFRSWLNASYIDQ
jgi:acetyl-CoA acetyltransferase